MLITDEQFAAEFQRVARSVFRVDRTVSPPDRERQQFEQYLAGSLTPPTEWDWLSPWLAQLARWRVAGTTFTRVRVLAIPPTGYQLWLLWGTQWMTEAGETIRYMSSTAAQQNGLPDWEWCLLDDAHVIEMRPESKTLVTDSAAVARYRVLRDIALRTSVTPEDAAEGHAGLPLFRRMRA